jgi:hypothetical protein
MSRQHIKDRAVYLIGQRVEKFKANPKASDADKARFDSVLTAAQAKPVEWFEARISGTEHEAAMRQIQEIGTELGMR